MTHGAAFAAAEEAYPFRWSDQDDPYLAELRAAYALDAAAGAGSDLERARALTAWVHGRWHHDGGNVPARPDPLSILREAERGRSFRCVEYATVLAGALSAVGIPARVLTLMTADVETRPAAAAHAVTEAWLPDRRRWLMLDAQWGTVQVARGEPLNALQLGRVFARSAGRGGAAPLRPYFAWIAEYLHFLEAPLDARIPVPAGADPRRLMLLPADARPPRVFQGKWALTDVLHTRSETAFYPDPLA